MSSSTPGKRHAPWPEDYYLTTPLISSPATLRNRVLVSALHICSIHYDPPNAGKRAAAPRYMFLSMQSRCSPLRSRGRGPDTLATRLQEPALTTPEHRHLSALFSL